MKSGRISAGVVQATANLVHHWANNGRAAETPLCIHLLPSTAPHAPHDEGGEGGKGADTPDIMTRSSERAACAVEMMGRWGPPHLVEGHEHGGDVVGDGHDDQHPRGDLCAPATSPASPSRTAPLPTMNFVGLFTRQCGRNSPPWSRHGRASNLRT